MAKNTTKLWMIGIGSVVLVGGVIYLLLRNKSKLLQSEQELGKTQAELDAEKQQAYLNRQFANLSAAQKKKVTQPIANALAGLGLYPKSMLKNTADSTAQMGARTASSATS